MSVNRNTYRTPFERLETRSLMSTTLFDQTNLVSDQPGVAQIQDKHLINGWGIALNPKSGAFWVSANDAGFAELYTGDLKGSSIAKAPLSVSIPKGEATGVVNNTTSDFVVSDGHGHKGPAVFIFASEEGNITGWNPAVPPPAPSKTAQSAARVEGAFFTGISEGNAGGKNFLYGADFGRGKVVVLDKNFHVTTLAHNFVDPHLPAGYGPHNIQNIGGHLYITYAKMDPAQAGHEIFGAGNGFVDEFSTSGRFIQRVASGGMLNAPWGMALASNNFGSFSGDFLVGNLGDGHITAFDPRQNFKNVGQLKDAQGHTIAIDRLWGLQFGNGMSSGDTNALYFAAGPNHYEDGLFGSIRIARNITVSPSLQNGVNVMTIDGTGDKNQVSVAEDTMSDTTTVATDGRTQVFDRLFSELDIALSGKHSHLKLDVPGTTFVTLNVVA
jgi:uncharacterized protein (TIGR03118 family)